MAEARARRRRFSVFRGSEHRSVRPDPAGSLDPTVADGDRRGRRIRWDWVLAFVAGVFILASLFLPGHGTTVALLIGLAAQFVVWRVAPSSRIRRPLPRIRTVVGWCLALGLVNVAVFRLVDGDWAVTPAAVVVWGLVPLLYAAACIRLRRRGSSDGPGGRW